MKKLLLMILAVALVPLQTFADTVAAASDVVLKKSFMADYGFFSDVLNFLLTIPAVGPYITVLLSFMGSMALLAAILPAGTEGTTWYKIRKWLIDLPAANILNAKNK